MPKHLLIFGAGASYGSDTVNKTPPLTNELFDQLVKFNPPDWGSLNKNFAQLFKKDFEKGMEQYAIENPQNITILQRAMAMYFFNYRPSDSNLYYKLAQKIKNANWDGAFSTLNYERLLEISLSTIGFQPYIGKKPNKLNNPIELCLPHGYCNIFCTSVQANPTTVFSGCSVDGPVKIASTAEEFKKKSKMLYHLL